MPSDVAMPRVKVIAIAFAAGVGMVGTLTAFSPSQRTFFNDTDAEQLCVSMQHARIDIGSLEETSPSMTPEQQTMLSAAIARIADQYEAGAKIDSVPEAVMNSLLVGNSTLRSAAEDATTLSGPSRTAARLNAMGPVNSSIARWCTRYAPPA